MLFYNTNINNQLMFNSLIVELAFTIQFYYYHFQKISFHLKTLYYNYFFAVFVIVVGNSSTLIINSIHNIRFRACNYQFTIIYVQ